MNLLGKIFVFIVFIMSLVFGTMAMMMYATQTNWRDEIFRDQPRGALGVGWKKRYEQVTAERDQARSERERLEVEFKAEVAARAQALAKAEATIQTLRNENAALEENEKKLQAQLASATAALTAAQANLSDKNKEVEQLRTELVAANRAIHEQVDKATAATDKLAIATGQLAVLKERNEQLAIDVGKAKQLLNGVGMTLEDEVVSNLKIDGVVTAVGNRQVEVSIGSDDGLRVGRELEVYRGPRYVGRVKLSEVQPKKAVATVMNEFLQFPIQRGDNVSTRL
jgi:SMC interacting uncharacterized protein involved in chromosome segregation